MEVGRARVLFFAVLAALLPLAALQVGAGYASAAQFSGKWVSATPGQGLIQEDGVSTRYFDWEWTLNEYGSYVEASGSYTLTENIPNPSYDGYDPWPPTIGITYPYYNPQIPIVGDQLIIDWAELEPDQPSSGQIVLTVSGDRMYGSGSYVDSGVLIFYEYDLKREGIFGSLLGPMGIIPITSVGFIVIFIVIIVTVTKPVPISPTSKDVSPYSRAYEPSDVRTTDDSMSVSFPQGGTPTGGVGITIPPPPPSGRPLSPKEHFSRTYEPPRCPIHGDTALVAHYRFAEGDPGSWYCPKCKGYPWGRS